MVAETDPVAPRVREACHPLVVNTSYSAQNGNDLRHNVLQRVSDENTNTCVPPTTVASRPYREPLADPPAHDHRPLT
jgi:hypothetical protein